MACIEGHPYIDEPLFQIKSLYKSMADSQRTVVRRVKAQPRPTVSFHPAINGINIRLPEACHISLKVYTLTGRRAFTLDESHMQSGRYCCRVPRGELPAGIYPVKLECDGITFSDNQVIIKP